MNMTENQLLSPSQPVYRQVINLKVPASTSWDPDQAQQLMISLFGIGRPLNLIIQATAHYISWSIEIGAPYLQAVTSALHALYPQAQVAATAKAELYWGYYRYQLESATPYIGPLKSVSAFKKYDPLALIVGAMKNINEQEALVYELVLGPAHQPYAELGEKLLTISNVNWAEFLTTQGAAEALARKRMGADQTAKYTPDIERAARAKLNTALMEARLFFKIKAQTHARADALLEQLLPAFATFDEEGLSFLVEARAKSFPLVLSAAEVAALWHPPTTDCQTQGIAWATGAVAPLPTQLIIAPKQLPNDEIVLGTNVYQGKTERVRLGYADRITHVNLIGHTRVGKSTLLHHMIHQDIQAGKGVGVIDPHGDLVHDIMATSIPDARLEDVVLFDVADQDYPVGLNLLSPQHGLKPEVVAGATLAVIRKMFSEQWSASRMEDVLYACLASLVTHPGATIQDIPKLLSHTDFRSQVLRQVNDLVARDFWLDEFEPLSPAHQIEIARPINSRLRRLYRNPTLRRILCQTGSLDFRHILDTKKIFLANLGGLADVEGETLGALLIAKMQMAAMSRGSLAPQERAPFYLYIDEVQNFITTSLSTMFSEAAKYGLSLVVANQFLKQLEGDTLEAILGNVGTTIIFRVGPDDARVLAGFVQPQVSREDLLNLDRFHTVVKMQSAGQTLPAFSMITPPPLSPTDNAAEKCQRIREQSRHRYARPQAEVDHMLAARYDSQAARPLDSEDEDSNGFLG